MARTMFIILSHELTEEQKEDAKERLGVTDFVKMPEELSVVWRSIPPDADSVSTMLSSIKGWLKDQAREGDIALIQGDFGATFHMVDFAFNNGIRPVYSTTKREVKESVNSAGEIVSERRFKHVRFRNYERC